MYKNIIISIFAFLFASNLMAEDCSLMSCDDTSHKHSYVVNADGVTLEEIYGLTPMDEMLDIFEQLKEL